MADRPSFDVLVIGSGASGLAAAVSAAHAGARVAPGPQTCEPGSESSCDERTASTANSEERDPNVVGQLR